MDQDKFNAVTIKLLEDIIERFSNDDTELYEFWGETADIREMREKLDKLKELYVPDQEVQ